MCDTLNSDESKGESQGTAKSNGDESPSQAANGVAYVLVRAGRGMPPATPKPKDVTPLNLQSGNDQKTEPPKKD